MNILVPVDFHETSFSAYLYAMQLADKIDGKVTLLHVINGSFNVGQVIYDPLLSLEDGALKKLTYFANDYASERGIDLPKIPTNLEVRFGIPGFTITDFAKNHFYDLVIMGTRDKHGIFDRLLGSASSITLRLATCPVILIHKGNRFNTPSKIAFAFDSKSDLEASLEDYKKINSKLGAKTDFIHINLKGKDDLSKQKEEIVEELFEDSDPNFSFEIKALKGDDLRSSIKDYCLFEKVDLLAMVHRKEGLFFNLFRGNQSVRMSQDFHLPVIVFHEERS